MSWKKDDNTTTYVKYKFFFFFLVFIFKAVGIQVCISMANCSVIWDFNNSKYKLVLIEFVCHFPWSSFDLYKLFTTNRLHTEFIKTLKITNC
jgi:hypothetical protein